MENFDFNNMPNDLSTMPRKSKKAKSFGLFAVILVAVLSATIGASSAAAVYHFSDKTTVTEKNVIKEKETEQEEQLNNININVDQQASNVVEAVAKKVTPSVVGIRTTTSVTSFFGNQEASGEGSGVIYKSNGYIITNYHVIADATTNSSSKIEVFLDSDVNSKSYEASVVGYNISSDLAVIKIDAKGLSAVELADSDKLKVGQYVITVGNPGGLEFMDSVTYGVISGLDRVVSSDSGVSLIQTDAAINPGNSGGALVNTNGELVGINSSKIASVEFEGMGFAIPSNTVVEICNRIIDKENSPEAYIGITISEKYTAELLEYYGYPNGAVVSNVIEGSPAYQAGIRRGDIITEFDGSALKDYTALERLFEKVEPNQKIKVKIYRSGNYYTTTLTVGSNNSVE